MKIDRFIFMYLDFKNNECDSLFLYFDSFYSVTLADNIVIYLSLVIIHGNLLNFMTVEIQH